MKVIIAGSRSIKEDSVYGQCGTSWGVLDQLSELGFSEIVSGTANGADQLGEKWAKYNSLPVIQFPADWDKHKKSAGYIRNSEMADYADCLIALWDGKSKGTQHMITTAMKKGLKVYVFTFDT